MKNDLHQRQPILLSDGNGDPTTMYGDLHAEPASGSVVLASGALGTAWQRHSDGLWYCTVGSRKGQTWAWLFANRRNLVLVYETTEQRRYL